MSRRRTGSGTRSDRRGRGCGHEPGQRPGDRGRGAGFHCLLVLGLAISIPLIIAGAALIMALLDRLPILVWAGAALLGWVAGEMLSPIRG